MIRFKLHIKLVFLVAYLGWAWPVFSQDEYWEESDTTSVEVLDYEAYESVTIRELNESKWDTLISGLNYDTPVEKESRDENQSSNSNRKIGNTGVWANIFKFLFIAILASILAWVLWNAFQVPGSPRAKTKQKASVSGIQQKELKEVMELSEDEKALNQAIYAENYTEAIRLQYIRLVGALVRNKHIKWKKDKTNSDYLREVKHYPYYPEFKFLTWQYENIWYGKHPITDMHFKDLSPRFQSLENQIKNLAPIKANS